MSEFTLAPYLLMMSMFLDRDSIDRSNRFLLIFIELGTLCFYSIYSSLFLIFHFVCFPFFSHLETRWYEYRFMGSM